VSPSEELPAAGQLDRGHEAEALVADGPCELDALAGELLVRRLDVVAHEVELVMEVAVRGMRGQLGRRQGEDEPAASGVDRRELERVAQEGAEGVRVLAEDHRMGSVDHRVTSVRRGLAVRRR
jgi:hypothetical protein